MIAGPVMNDLVRDLSGAATGSLVAAVWQGTLLAGAAALGLRMLPKTPAAVRFAIWFAVFVLVGALPFASVWAHSTHSAAPSSHAAWLTVDARWSEAVLLVWAAASAVRAAMLVVAAVRVRALWRRAVPLAQPNRAGQSPTGQTVFGRKVEVCTSGEVDRPSVIGFFAPKILIPTWLVDELTAEEMNQVVLHEAGHLLRADDWLNLLQKIALVVFPLNPALAWVERRLCFERELACDERVLKATGAPKAYASCLASLAEHRMTRRGIALVMGALGRETELGQRVRRILSRSESMRPGQSRLVMGGAVVMLLAAVAGLEQCPQLVGFASPSTAVAGREGMVSPAGYRNVVYRSGRTGMPMRAVDTVARMPVAAAAHTKQANAAAAFGAMRMKKGSARQVPRSAEQSSQSRQSTTEWVVLTSWSADTPGYPARMVMTSVQTSGAPAENAGRESDEVRTDSPARQIFPYAAVPVRGGWLVIQL